jgi:hypothetical protein
MSSKSALPPIDDELRGKGKRVDLRAIRPKGDADDATIEENSRLLGNEWGASTSLKSVQQPSPAPLPPRAPVASLRIEVPVYLDDELTRKAAEKRVTKQYLVLTALRSAGYRIDDPDLVADKRRRGGDYRQHYVAQE